MDITTFDILLGAAATFIGALVGAFVQLKTYKTEAKKTDSTIYSELIDKALQISKDEISNQKLLYEILKGEYTAEREQNTKLKEKIECLERENDNLRENNI